MPQSILTAGWGKLRPSVMNNFTGCELGAGNCSVAKGSEDMQEDDVNEDGEKERSPEEILAELKVGR